MVPFGTNMMRYHVYNMILERKPTVKGPFKFHPADSPLCLPTRLATLCNSKTTAYKANHQVVRFLSVNPIDENTPKEASKRIYFCQKEKKPWWKVFFLARWFVFFCTMLGPYDRCVGNLVAKGRRWEPDCDGMNPKKTQCNSGPAGNNTSRGLCVFVGENSYGKRFKGLVPTSAQNMENTRWNVSRMVNPEWLHASWHMEPYDQEGEIRITTPKPSEMVLFRVKVSNPTSIIWRVWG